MEFVEFELTKEFRDRFQQALDESDNAFILDSLGEVNPADITALLYEFNSNESKTIQGDSRVLTGSGKRIWLY